MPWALLAWCGEGLAAARLSQALDVLEPSGVLLEDEALERRLSELLELSRGTHPGGKEWRRLRL